MSLTCLHLFLTFNLLFGLRLNVKKDKITFKRIFKMSSTPDYSNLAPESTPILDTVNFPRDLKRLDMKQLKQVFICYHQLIYIYIYIYTYNYRNHFSYLMSCDGKLLNQYLKLGDIWYYYKHDYLYLQI